MARRFHRAESSDSGLALVFANAGFTGEIRTRPDRLDIPLRTRKPTVWAVWNDLFHEAVPDEFIKQAFDSMPVNTIGHFPHTYLVLTKRAQRMADFFQRYAKQGTAPWPKVYLGLTVCNQQEADAKIPVFLQVPGRKFLSIEPMLGPVDLEMALEEFQPLNPDLSRKPSPIDAVILGGETGPGARPMQPDWVRSVRDQCAAAGVPFFFKQWGKWGLNWLTDDNGIVSGSEWMDKTIKKTGRVIDGRTHDELPWVLP